MRETKFAEVADATGEGHVRVCVDHDGDVEIYPTVGDRAYLRPETLVSVLKTLGVIPADTPTTSTAAARVHASWRRHARSDTSEREALRDHVIARDVERYRLAQERADAMWQEITAAWERRQAQLAREFQDRINMMHRAMGDNA